MKPLLRAILSSKAVPGTIRSLIRRALPSGVEEIGGYRWKLYPADNIYDREMWMHGYLPETEEMAEVLARLPASPVIFDIGANSGLFTVVLGASSPSAHVHAFEPNPVMVARLAENLALNGLSDQVDIHPVALADQPGATVLTIHPHNAGQSSMVEGVLTKGTTGIDVAVETLPRIIERLDLQRIDFVKIDVEGAEELALRPLLAQGPEAVLPGMILIEHIHQTHWERDLMADLAQAGYAITRRWAENTLLSRSSVGV